MESETRKDAHAELARHFVRRAEQVRASSPLYAQLADVIAREPDVLALASQATRDQPPGLLLLAAIHALVLQGYDATPSLATFYPSVVAKAVVPGDLRSAVRAFCRTHHDAIRQLVPSRRVQTNEVGRSACLVPAFGLVARDDTNQPLALVEIGASAGLNLLWDRYRYDYGDAGHCGNPASKVTLTCVVRGERPPIPWLLPRAGARGDRPLPG